MMRWLLRASTGNQGEVMSPFASAVGPDLIWGLGLWR